MGDLTNKLHVCFKTFDEAGDMNDQEQKKAFACRYEWGVKHNYQKDQEDLTEEILVTIPPPSMLARRINHVVNRSRFAVTRAFLAFLFLRVIP
jgi:hypothetical protein